ncbi:MAG: glucose-6-phosphate isomerase [Spirochaetes bacterium]|nr:glucose-6-phosphate isomerase [Spirochaetota bacterium]MBU1081524.1 glucose-6-phosphate isomerase [Spirochaetota bacterium]
MKRWKRIDELSSWPTLLSRKAAPLSSALTPERIGERVIAAGGGLDYSYAAMDADDDTVSLLAGAAAELDLLGQYEAVATGELMNPGEGRMVLHHIARGTPCGPVVKDGRDYRAFYEAERLRAAEFARGVRSGATLGSTGKRFERVVQIGIGGSDLGPRALYLALERWARERGLLGLEASFISNVDPDDANGVLSGLDPETSLFVLVSKSGTTQETLANEALVKAWLASSGKVDPSRHLVAVTSETSPLARNPAYLDSFYIDDFIGGRYSATSAVGGVVLSVALGPETFEAMLGGAAEADRLALEPDLRRNAAMMDAMLGIFERDVLGRPGVAVLPYSQALSRFPAHLQQLDMESNGKRVDRAGRPVAIPSGPAVFGEPGTNGQHSFYQLLHQGTDVVPIQFIGFRKNQSGFDPAFEGSTARRKLNANLAAQIVAFAVGKDDADPNKRFPGGRPSSLLVGDELDPRALGALLAHYENKVMFQGFAWNLNSFDQEGVQLGKKLTAAALAAGGPSDPALAAYVRLLGAL